MVAEASGELALAAEYAFALYIGFEFPFGFPVAYLSRLVSCLKSRHLLQALRIARPLRFDVGRGSFDLTKIVRSKLDFGGSDVFFEAIQFRGARDGNDPGLLRQQPGQRDLGRGGFLLLGKGAEQIDKCLVGLDRLGRKPRQRTAEVRALKLRSLVNLPRKEPLSQRAVGNQANAQFLEGGQYFRFRLAPPERVFTLQYRDGLYGVGSTDRLCGCFGHSEMLDLTGLDQFLDRAGGVLDGHIRVDAVLIEQVDGFELEPQQGAFHGLLDVFGLTVNSGGSRLVIFARQIEAELGGNDHLPAEWGQGLPHQFLVDERAVDFGRVKEGDTAIDGGMQKGGHLLLVFGGSVGEAHTHAAKADGRNFEIAFSQCALFHGGSSGPEFRMRSGTASPE